MNKFLIIIFTLINLFSFIFQLLKPIQSSKKEAQYLFSKEATNTIIKLIKSLNIKHVLCIGTPRIHEQILSDFSPDIDSLLLDIDHRYVRT